MNENDTIFHVMIRSLMNDLSNKKKKENKSKKKKGNLKL